MNINRHNYEEFFLLYTDNELSAEQQREVELFVQQHPDLAEEFEMLQQTKLLPDEHIVFSNKDALLNIARTNINLSNYEEYFLLKLDNELSKDELGKVDKFLAQHPLLQKQFQLLQQTKLPLELIEFPDKKSLYRTEEKERRVVAFRFTKFAVAAAMLGIAALVWWMVPQNKQIVEIANLKSVQKETIKPKDKITEPAEQPAEKTEIAVVPKSEPKTEDIVPASVIKQKHVPEKIKPNVVKQNAAQLAITQQKNKNNLPEVNSGVKELPSNETPVIAQNNSPIIDKPIRALKPLEEVNKDEIKSQTASYIADTKKALTQPAAYKEINTDNDNETVYIGSMQLNKNKVKGLLKKATRVFGNKVKDADNDGKLQVAAFELDTRKSK
ncbi:MAG: anti-sigma factor family protein [Ilyomonas sp.]